MCEDVDDELSFGRLVKTALIHCSAKVTHLWTSQTSPGWVISSVWPCPDPSTSVLRISGSEALERTVRDAHKGNSGVIVWSVLLNCSSSPIKGIFFFYILFHWFFFSVLFVFIPSSKMKLDSVFYFIFSLRGFWVKEINLIQGCLGCTRTNFTSLSAII